MEQKSTGYPSVDKPWLKFYSEKSRNYKIPGCSIYEYMTQCSNEYGDCVALEYFGQTVTYNQMQKNIEKVAKALKSFGIKERDIVSVCLPNIPEVVYVFYAINRIGAVANMLDPRNNAEDLKEALNDAKSTLLFSLDTVVEKFDTIIYETGVKQVVAISALNTLPVLLQKIVMLKDKSLGVKLPPKAIYTTYKRFVSQERNYNGVLNGEYDAEAPAVIAYTGGTTGKPKGVVTTNRCMNAMVVLNAEMDYNVEIGDRCLAIAPPWTYYGLSNSLNAYLAMGLQVVLIPKLEADGLGKLIKKYKPNHIISVPSALYSVMQCEEIEAENLSFIKTIIVGADKLTEQLEVAFNHFLEEHGCETVVTKGYGMTEVTAATTYTRNNCNIIGSVGIPYIANIVSVFSYDTEEIEEYKIGTTGEIAIHGPMLMQGYFGKYKSETGQVLKKHKDGKLWAHTGDLGHIDEDGRLHVDGRIKRMFVKNGYKIFPGAIEECIRKHPAIKECAVVAVEDDYNGNEIKAYMVQKKDVEESKEEIWNEVLNILQVSLFDYELPGTFEFLEKLPLTGMGKIDYRALEKEAEQQ